MRSRNIIFSHRFNSYLARAANGSSEHWLTSQFSALTAGYFPLLNIPPDLRVADVQLATPLST